jgi:outer membrane protein assembly factor BamB
MTTLRFAAVILASLTWISSGISPASDQVQRAGPGQAKQILAAAGVQGGLVVHLGCGDGKLTAALRAGEGYLVQGLDVDANNVETARKNLQSMGLYGDVSVDRWDGRQLPYVDNSVNLIVAEDGGQATDAEILRVLAPDGVAYAKKDGKWRKIVKPRPNEIDQWTHYLHGPDNNAVADDTVIGPPRRLQWQGGPKWTRHHDHMSSISALVSSGGRLFYIMDEGSMVSLYLPSHWALIARDAFNGKVLWKRPIDTWYTRYKVLKDGPADAPRRLIAAGDTVYATLALDGPLTALDAAIGKTIRTYPGTKGAEEVLLSDGVLFVLVGPGSLGDGGRATRPVEKRTIMALKADSGAKLWESSDVVAAMTLAVDGTRAYYFNFDQKTVVGLDRKTGRRCWVSEKLPTPERQTSYFASKLVVHDDVVLLASGELSGTTKSGPGETRDDTLTALSAETGKTLWKAKHPPSGYSSPEDLFVINGLVWCDTSSNGNLDGTVIGFDLKTGAEKHRFPADQKNYWFHHRCYSGRATTNYIMTSRTGIEFIDFREQHWDLNHWVRGACLYGFMPANGLVYTPPAPCICYAESMLHSFNAFAPAKAGAAPAPVPKEKRLEKGPAYGNVQGSNVQGSMTSEDHAPLPTSHSPLSTSYSPRSSALDDWPTYRAGPSRSASIRTAVPPALTTAWKAEVGGRLSSLVVADGKVYVAAVDRHTVHALDAASGKTLWQYTVGGPVDSPPTYFEGRVLFGCTDGWVYCLRAADGALAWRFLAAPADRRIVSYEQLESLWPVHGSVLVRDGIAHFVAGRSIFVDGGMRYYRVDARTGDLLSETVLDDRNPATGGNVLELVKWLNMPVGRPDILSCDEKQIYMRSQAFDFQGHRLAMGPTTDGPQEGSNQAGEGKHVFCPTGFLDDTWFHRTYWLYGKTWGSGWNGYFINGKFTPGGKILCVDDDAVYAFDRLPQYYRWTTPLEFRLYAARKQWKAPAAKPQAKVQNAGKKGAKKKGDAAQPSPVENQENYLWTTRVPILVRAMALAGRTLFIAGPQDVMDESRLDKKSADEALALKQEAAWQGKAGAVLWAVSAEDGKKLAGCEIDAPPIFDGMAAARGRLYIATIDGKVLCLGAP